MYVRIVNNNPVWYYTPDRLRSDEPNTSFPESISNNLLAEFNVFPLAIDSRPSTTQEQTAVLLDPVFENDAWVQHWEVQDLDSVAIELIYNRLAGDIRQRRAQLLQECDWTQGRDIPTATSNLWKPYRKELRDITEQSGFPANVIWPTPPA
jgi:hypothetical protein